LNWIRTTGSVTSPLSCDGELAPGLWEDLAQVHFVEVDAPVLIPHPPGTVITEDIVKFFFQAFVVVPSLVFISELTSPLSLTPRVTDSHQLKSINITNLKHTISMIK
jgi:hypothetical protein